MPKDCGVCKAFWYASILSSICLIAACESSVIQTAKEREYSSPLGKERAVIVFVHGILGDSDLTFRSENAQLDWPQMLAEDSSLGHPVKTISIGYLSRPLERGSNIHEIATRLQIRLRDMEIFTRFDKVIFVTHSMGGLISKEVLLQLQIDDPTAFGKVAGIFFLATPSGGSNLADLALWMSHNPQFKDMASADFNTYLQTIEDEWQALLRQRKTSSPYPKSFCAYEKLSVGPFLVVPRSRSQFGCNDREIAFDRTHTNLVKPAGREDEVYQYVATRIRKLLAGEFTELHISAALLSSDGQRIPSSVALKSGEAYLLELTSNRPAWFAIFARDVSGKVQRYFPSVAAGEQSHPRETLRIPTDVNKAFVLDDNKGAEEIIIFATIANKEELRKIGEEVQSSGAQAGETLDKTLATKGAKVGNRPVQRPTGNLQRIEAVSTEADATVRLFFWHE